MRRWFFFIFLTCGSLFLPLLIQHFTLGFHPSKLHFGFPYHLEKPMPPMNAEIKKILSQPFTYLNRGSQSYVFESQDKKYVLKLFRYNRSRFPWIQKIKKWIHKKEKASLLSKIEKTFNAYAIAFLEVPECTQLLYVHLKSDLENLPQIALIDPVGRKWCLQSSQYRFVLQRKADSFKSTLTLALKNEEEMKLLLNSFISLLVKRTHHCIRNSDHNLWPNFGFIENQAIEIDCGNYRKWPVLANPELRIQEMEKFLSPLYQWLLKNEPTYAHFFQANILKEIQKIKSPSSIEEGPTSLPVFN